ncbi:lysophospholipase L1-like esterase [Rhizomicrobium palustre]|uniref:Lysophospholipase L1-like esterase n=1 Tax=Rhizomicrobium palustre TaxID=189966 RepID=A0A846N0P3_9PROT|nr:rhamnogalacturonan acetylesterase [Rhizomicrobium palustre]NIK89133.1 lysophospholipase L1-like esterase [Rhizomicrobium palustre]
MTKVAVVLCAACFALPAAWAEEAHFIFHSGSTTPGAIRVGDDFAYAPDKGYGFEPAGAVVDSAAHCARPASPTADPIIVPDHSARFSVALPEGSYRVTLTFAKAPKGAITAEAGRFILLPSASKQKLTKTQSFIIDVRHAALPTLPLNAPGGIAVRLNPRECGSYSWDGKLTLGFASDAANIKTLDIVPVEVPRLFLMGDSTVTDQPQPPYAGWGQMLPLFFGNGIAIANHAESGETLKSFLSELRLDKVLSQAKTGDWALLQFSHNDEKSQWPQTHEPAGTTFPLYLKVYIAELRRHGVNPVLVTPMQRLRFDTAGKIIETHGAYPDAIRAVAASENVPLIDLTAMSRTLFEALGPEKARAAFAGNGADATHQSAYGAYELARAVVESMRRQKLPITEHLKPGLAAFDPATPDALIQP